MEDWNVDLLFQVISYLNVKDSGNFGLQSRRCYYLVHQYRQLRGPQIVSVGSAVQGVRSRQMTADTMCRHSIEQLQAPPDLALIFEKCHNNDLVKKQLLPRIPPSTVVLEIEANSLHTMNCESEDTAAQCHTNSHSGVMLLSGLSANAVVQPFCYNSDELHAFTDHSLEENMSSDGSDHIDCASSVDSSAFWEGLTAKDLDWKMFIIYVTDAGVEFADKFLSRLQDKFPESTIVGGVSNSASVSTDLFPDDYTAESLGRFSSQQLLTFNTDMGGCKPRDVLTKSELIHHVVETAKTKQYVLSGCDVRGMICGVAISGNVPVRSIVSRGVKSLTNAEAQKEGRPPTETSLYVREAELRSSVDNDYIFTEESGSYHLIELIEDRITGKTYGPNELITRFGSPDYLGIRRAGSDGFSLEMPHPISANINNFFLWPSTYISDKEDLVGANIDLYTLSGQECKDDVARCMLKLKEQTKDEEILGALMITCSGRRRGSLFNEDMVDGNSWAQHFAKVPIIGFYANGEIGPLALAGRRDVFREGKACMQGFTAVYALFIVPKLDLSRVVLDDSKERIDGFFSLRHQRKIRAAK